MFSGFSPRKRRPHAGDRRSASNNLALDFRDQLDPPEDPIDPDADEVELDPAAVEAWELSALEDEDEDEPEPEYGDFWPQEEDLDD
jgi:hypothetical protein